MAMTESNSKSSLVAQTASVQWLSLKEASDLLGVHFTTLRKWSDEGEIRVFRTPGGHRRFSITDLRRFLEDRVKHDVPADAEAFVDAAVGQVRAEIEKLREEHMAWAQSLTESARDHTRQRGRQLFSLAIAYVVKPSQRDRLLIEGQQLGFEYGEDAATVGMPLVETGRAVQFFRSQLSKAVRAENSHGLDADDLRIQGAIDHFLDEVLYAVLSGYEHQLSSSNPDIPTSDSSPSITTVPHNDPPPTNL
jgi:excisionase family DNA binding protein